jgi:hypothetical protein
LQQPGVSSCHQAPANIDWYLMRKVKRHSDWDSFITFPESMQYLVVAQNM